MAIFDHRLMQIGNTQTFVLFKIKYRNASIKRPGAYSISKLWGGCLFEGGRLFERSANIFASI